MAEFAAVFINVLGHALLDFLWQGALIGMLATIAMKSLHQARPQARYAVACLALLACVLVPFVSVIASLALTSSAVLSAETPTVMARIVAGAPARFDVVPAALQFDAALPWIVALWAAGTCVMSWRMAVGMAWIRRLRRTPQDAAHALWQARLDALAQRLGLRRAVALCLVQDLDSPVTAGWWRPVVLLPAALLMRMPTELIEALLAHELAHIRRHDYLVNLLQHAIEAVLFYHPVTWWLSRRIRIERESIADQLATETACAPRDLALALCALSEPGRSNPAMQLAPAARGGQLLSRIELLLQPPRRAHAGARIALSLLGLFAAGIGSYAYAHIAARERANEVGPERRMPVAAMRDTYALVRENADTFIWGPSDDMTAIGAAQLGVSGDFLWVRRGSDDYLITDPALVARATNAWRKSEVLGREIEILEHELGQLQQQLDTYDRRLDAIRPDGPAETLAYTRERDRWTRVSTMLFAKSQRWNALSAEHETASEQAAREMKSLTNEALAKRLALTGPPRQPSS